MTTLSKIIVATVTKIIVALLISFTLFSCNFDISFGPGIKGNGNVVEETRPLNGSFNAIKATEGLQVYLTQSDNESVLVEADENLQKLIIAEVVDNTLKIHTKENIGWAEAKKVYVNFKNISNIASSSGSNVHTTNTINANNLTVESSSGSNISLDIKTNSLSCEASSGSSIKLNVDTSSLSCESSSGSNIIITGKTTKLIAEASSGSGIRAGDLIAESSQVNASSGSNITVNTSKELVAKASSGAGINYYGNPEKVEKQGGVSGSIQSK
ncbi:DUF2807 domain-containing protein [Flavobacteriaceae bacterium XHP0103]|uniref:head GIN domain-containing protein n=1 Tax=Marixanthotalea marina TaxID=2844359 RepID=UPI002989F5E4|nr:head GIN domain-containing protein [Marixanthotalea marina]MBU3822835.1 DUF2807 domain-containing protein [Marixanthotalea marina]